MPAEMAVVVFRGSCDLRDLEPRGTFSGSLGRTQRVDGVVLPYTSVDCDGIRRYLQRGLLMLPREAREPAFGRALGRVVAHELHHILANTPKHAQCGVGKATYTEQDLLGKNFRFQDGESGCALVRMGGLEPQERLSENRATQALLRMDTRSIRANSDPSPPRSSPPRPIFSAR